MKKITLFLMTALLLICNSCKKDEEVALTRTDLSESGTSNTYMVNKPGLYKFKATVKGNGVVPTSQTGTGTSIAPAKAKVLWCTYNTETAPATTDELITEVEYSDGYISFRTANLSQLVPGNSVIAATDADGNILWSWLIWQCETPGIITATAAKWQDCNLGSVNGNAKKDSKAFGLMFQWGRKDPFRCGCENGSNKYIGTAGETWPTPENVSATNGTIAYLTAHPMAFPKAASNGDNKNDWFYPYGTAHDDLWYSSGKTMFDPCPLGYRVHTAAEASDVATSFSLSKTDIDMTNWGIGNKSWWYPYAGGLSYDSGIPTNVGLYCYYSNSGVSQANAAMTRGHGTSINFGAAAGGKAWATSIRCVKE